MERLDALLFRDLVCEALKEDLGHGDVTTTALVPEEKKGQAVIKAKENLVLCGLPVALEVFRTVDPEIEFSSGLIDGQEVARGETVARIRGRLSSILKAERVALNFLQHLSGVATQTRKFVRAIEGLPVRLVDTRKTTPGFRILEKYAVRVGGAHNHRFGLSDGVLIKDNHIRACGSITAALARAREKLPHVYLIEIEVRDLDELKEALEAGAPAILLDNMDLETLGEAVSLAKKRAPGVILEASGGIHLENIRAVAETGVDIISVGRLTHSAPAVDLSLEVL
ncbi:nicotinate-nucleotide pyrophosphorylase (carboxylating) [Thermosulfuriphilus ammonigenes]|uniref:carboxylating nicotinate-nucleotide diphosphorylase n=1 Tax=Thermosulfuriphilus ammonigenes TaxID=1936021 RepID=UPI0015EBD683|nr:carboxylating nicotinate-nucleotide diphosphorylase [Thermosulfuriphilus ammonigenes]MBA2849460.1 nicotinate-nucleotide pyrophosphorylase (carboxylating) [Thermosulfuriphilus ammonigenes]